MMSATNFRFLQLRAKNQIIYSNIRCYNYHINDKNKSINIDFAHGKSLTLSSGKYARFTNGTGICSAGGTSILTTVVAKPEPNKSSKGFVPFSVEYRQKYANAGRVEMKYFSPEENPSAAEILTSRLIDRSVRPLFPNGFNHDTQLTCNMLALDSLNEPDVLSINASSLALAVSDIPWEGPIGAVRVGLVNDSFILNPTRLELKKSSLDFVVAGKCDKSVVMLEGKADIVPYHKVYAGIKFGLKACKPIVEAIEEYATKYGRSKKSYKEPESLDAEIVDAIRALSEMRLNQVFENHELHKKSRDDAVNEIRKDVVDRVWTAYPKADPALITNGCNEIIKEVFRYVTLNKRCDGRNYNELRNISCLANLYEPLHGSALFQRGQTQVMASVTLDSLESALETNSVDIVDKGMLAKNFFLHYEFPKFAVGEISRRGTTLRRNTGHSALAGKGLLPIIPDDHPYTIRLISEVMESNGSSSMATVCAGSLALMDAGVPIKSPAAGVAIGVITKYDQDDPTKLVDYRILTDILGIEDYFGDLDLKVAATADGITAIQADIKALGLPITILYECLDKADAAKKQILEKMDKCIAMYRTETKASWPMRKVVEIEPAKRDEFVGSGSRNLNRLLMECGVQITETKPCEFNIFAPSLAAMLEFDQYMNESSEKNTFEFGGVYPAKVVELRAGGVMVMLCSSMEPVLIPLAQLDNKFVESPTDLGLAVGQEILVKYFGIDPVSGFLRLSRKVVKHELQEIV